MAALVLISTFSCAVFSLEEHDAEAPGVQRQPGGAPAQEEACQGPQRSEPGAVQEQSPPPTAFRPGEQPPAGTHTRQEEEEAPEQETHDGEFNIFYLSVRRRYSNPIIHAINHTWQM